MDWKLFGMRFSDQFAVDVGTSVAHEFITTKTLKTLVADRRIGLIPYLARHLAGDPGEVSDQDLLSDVYRCVAAWHSHYSSFNVNQDVRVIFASSWSRRVTFAIHTYQVGYARR